MWLMSDGGQRWTLGVCTWCANQVGPYRKEKVTGWFAVSPPRVRRRRTLSKMKTHGRKQWTVNKRRRDTPHEIMELRCFHYTHIMSIGQSGEDRPSSDDAAVNICEATTTATATDDRPSGQHRPTTPVHWHWTSIHTVAVPTMLNFMTRYYIYANWYDTLQ